MARESQPARTGLTLAINKDIWRANFYRFCQLLEQENPDVPKLGTTSHPGDDPVRFRPRLGMGFPVSTLKAVETDEDHPTLPPTVRTTFLGMYGVDSPLPTSGWMTLRSAAKGMRQPPHSRHFQPPDHHAVLPDLAKIRVSGDLRGRWP